MLSDMRQKADSDNCPICGQYITTRCVGHREKPFVDGNKYSVMCFTCFSIPKTWTVIYGKPTDGSEDVWNGPFFDGDHLHTPQELLNEGIVDNIKIAKISYKALVQKIKKAKQKSKLN
jgi:hypothetical protein